MINDPTSSNEKTALAISAPTPRLVSIDAARRLLGVGRSTVYDLINQRKLRAVKIGRRTLVPVEELDAYIEHLLGSA
jgi:excisionase family DNA binding protein